jgi:hypothetical protein
MTRKQAIALGLICLVLGTGLFLWDITGEYLHFYAYIPFVILGPIVAGLGVFFILAGALDRLEWLDR